MLQSFVANRTNNISSMFTDYLLHKIFGTYIYHSCAEEKIRILRAIFGLNKKWGGYKLLWIL